MQKIAALLITPALAIGGMLAGASTAHAQITVTQIVGNINAISSAAQNLSTALAPTDTSTSPSEVSSAAQDTVNGLSAMISNLAADDTALPGTSSLDAGDAQNVAAAFGNQVTDMQQMLATISGKHAVFAQFGLTAPLAAALRSLEASVDANVSALASVAPTQAASLTQQMTTLDQILGSSISLYGQTCIPSPLYPTIMPVCV
jgi:hypothetical protein